VVSAHCLEHQPDLIQHLIDVGELLNQSNKYYVVVPDKRFCFDHFLPPSGMSGIIRAHELSLKTPNRIQVLEHLALTTHNDPIRHWAGDHGSISTGLQERWNMAIEKFERSKGSYIDVHCWQFQPETFRDLIDNLYNLGFISLSCIQVFSTARNNLEFFAILEKN